MWFVWCNLFLGKKMKVVKFYEMFSQVLKTCVCMHREAVGATCSLIVMVIITRYNYGNAFVSLFPPLLDAMPIDNFTRILNPCWEQQTISGYALNESSTTKKVMHHSLMIIINVNSYSICIPFQSDRDRSEFHQTRQWHFLRWYVLGFISEYQLYRF